MNLLLDIWSLITRINRARARIKRGDYVSRDEMME